MTPADFAALDRAVRVVLPAILRDASFVAEAERLEVHAPITDARSALAAGETCAQLLDASKGFDAWLALHHAKCGCEIAATGVTSTGGFDVHFFVTSIEARAARRGLKAA